MKYWVISDTHFGHEKLVEITSRPNNFESIIINKVKKLIQPDDILIHLGDICINDDEYWNKYFTSSFYCKKWLTIGNHDKKNINWYLNNGWDFVANSFTINKYGHNILFSHFPEKEKGYTLNIHGHLHNNRHLNDIEIIESLNDKQFLLALEQTNYSPLNLQSIIKKFNSNK